VAVTSVLSALSEGPAATTSFRRLEQGGRIIRPPAVDKAAPQEGPGGAPPFLDLVKDFLSGVQDHQTRAAEMTKAFVAGEVTDLHQVTVASQEAGIALDLLIEIRNRTVEAFQEIMRIQV
jgi:flagellar hook-basal body complex protein FliE